MSAELSVTQSKGTIRLSGTGSEAEKTCAMRCLMRTGARVRLMIGALSHVALSSGCVPLVNGAVRLVESGIAANAPRLCSHFAPCLCGARPHFDGGGGGRDARRASLDRTHSDRGNFPAMARHSGGAGKHGIRASTRRKKRPPGDGCHSALDQCMDMAYGIPVKESPFAVWLEEWLCGTPPANVWIGASAEDQPSFNARYMPLSDIPARVRFWSMEPLLGSIDLTEVHYADSFKSRFHWVICGGESGPLARPLHPQWARDLRDQCEMHKVPFLFKQWGEHSPLGSFYGDEAASDNYDEKRDVVIEPEGHCVADLGDRFEHQPAPCSWIMSRVGKKNAGRILDGQTHTAFPRPL